MSPWMTSEVKRSTRLVNRLLQAAASGERGRPEVQHQWFEIGKPGHVRDDQGAFGQSSQHLVETLGPLQDNCQAVQHDRKARLIAGFAGGRPTRAQA